MNYNNNKTSNRKEAIEKVKKIVNSFYHDKGRAINAVFDGLNELIRSWGFDPRDLIGELVREGYKIVPGKSRNGIGYIKIFPANISFNKNIKELEKYIK